MVEALVSLPMLNGDELEELHVAIVGRMSLLAAVRAASKSPSIVAETDRRGLILQSLDTAVQEARQRVEWWSRPNGLSDGN